MLSLERPAYSVTETYAACADGVQDIDLRIRLVADTACVADASSRYNAAGENSTVASLAGNDFEMNAVSTVEMIWLYNKRLLGMTSRARPIYDALKQWAPYGRCSLCGVRDATTLDHYLPKSLFPSLAVDPLNLLPACDSCNRLKATQLASTVHAYFDRLSDETWLVASLVESKPCVVQFSLACPSNWSTGLTMRAEEHFTKLRLAELYSLQASRTLRGDALAFRGALESDGARGVRTNVLERAGSWADFNPNCWEAAMYRAMAASDWFCGGGFELD